MNHISAVNCILKLNFARTETEFNVISSISSNQRRKVLVGVALPFSFDQTENDEQQIEALDECDRLDIQEIFGDDDEHQEELDSYSSHSVVEHVTIGGYSPETVICDRVAVESIENKRKAVKIHNLSENGQPAKIIKIDVNQYKQNNGIDTTPPQPAKGRKCIGFHHS